MFQDLISAVGGDETLRHAVSGTGILLLLLPKVHLGLLVGLTCGFPNSPIHRAALEAFSVAQGGQLPPPSEISPPKKKRGKKKRLQGK